MRFEKNTKGLVLVMVLWVVVLLTIIVSSVSRSGLLNTKLCIATIDSVRCKWAARAGVETAMAILNVDLEESDSPYDMWAYSPSDFNSVPVGNCLFNVVVSDESGKLNINTVTKQQLLMLPNMTEQIADAILDWRDINDIPNGTGVESGYYIALPIGYKIRNGPFRTVRELLDVQGVTEELLYGINYSRSGGNKNVGILDPFDDNPDYLWTAGWINYLTCYSFDNNLDPEGNAKININNATQQVLTDTLGLSAEYANWIVQTRSTRRFTNIADLLATSTTTTTTTTTTQTGGQAAGPGGQTGQAGGQTGQAAQITGLDPATFASIAEWITTSNAARTNGKININTAPRYVLEALLANIENGRQFADNIIFYRNSMPQGVTSIGELVSVMGMDTSSFRQIANQIMVHSRVFTVRSFATAYRGQLLTAQLQCEAVVDRSTSPSQVLYWYQGQTN